MNAGIEWTTETPGELAGRFDGFADALEAELEAAIEDIVGWIESEAQDRASVDTGELRDSIEGTVLGVADLIAEGKIVAGADHAPFQEFGTIYQPPQPYLAPAFDAVRDRVVPRVQQAIENAKQEAFG